MSTKAIIDPIPIPSPPFCGFGVQLQNIRRGKGITQREAASRIGMDYGYWSKLENNRFDSLPTARTIEKIAKALDCTEEELDSLLLAAGRKCPHSDEEIEAMRNLREVCGMYCERLPLEVRDALHEIPEVKKTHRCGLTKTIL
jgi:transcriptional regulator with XRE-family HTH domain